METETIVVAIIAFIIGVLITRWIFSIDTIVKQLKMQSALLAKMAEKAGVSENEIIDCTTDSRLLKEASKRKAMRSEPAKLESQ